MEPQALRHVTHPPGSLPPAALLHVYCSHSTALSTWFVLLWFSLSASPSLLLFISLFFLLRNSSEFLLLTCLTKFLVLQIFQQKLDIFIYNKYVGYFVVPIIAKLPFSLGRMQILMFIVMLFLIFFYIIYSHYYYTYYYYTYYTY